MYHCIPPRAENGFSTNEGLFSVGVCNSYEDVPELLVMGMYSLTVNERRLNTNKVLSYVKSGNFIRSKHECR